MKIVHVICSLNTGGAELMLLDIIGHQSSLGHKVSLVVTNESYEQKLVDMIPESVHSVFIHRPEGSRNPWWVLKINLTIQRLHPDIVHLHNDNGAGMCFNFLTGGKMVATVHDTNISLNHYLKLDCLYAISDAVKDDLKNRYEIDTHVVPNGISFEKIKIRGVNMARTSGKFRIVQVSRIDHTKKGQDLLIEAVSRLVGQGYDLTVDFIGFGPALEFLEELCRQRGIEDRVRFLGICSRGYVYEHLCDYDLLVQPSRYEGFGLTVAEGMAAGIPVLVSDIEGPMEVIAHGRYGTSFKSGSADDLADKLRYICNNYEAVMSLAQGEAREYCRRNFSVGSTARAYIDQYNRLLK